MAVTDQEQFEQDQQVGVVDDQSLDARMQARAEAIQKNNTELFDIPGFEGLLQVELRRLGYKKMKQIQSRNAKERDEATRDIYNMADQILWATEGLYQVRNGEPVAIEDTWLDLAHRLPNTESVTTPRQAVLVMTGGDERILFLTAQWAKWMGDTKADEDEGVQADF